MQSFSGADTDTQHPNPTIKDRLNVHKTVLRLTAAYKTTAVVVCLIVGIIWYSVIKRTLAFSTEMDYSGLEALGLDGALIQQYTPFFWWTMILICTLLVFYLLFHFVQYTRRLASQKIVTSDQLEQLLQQMSPAAIHVLGWCWEHRRFPLTVGVLQQTQQQLAANRYSLICLAKNQENQLSKNRAAPPTKAEALHHL